MSTEAVTSNQANDKVDTTTPSAPKSLRIAKRGVKNSGDYKQAAAALYSDVVLGYLSPEVTNAACSALNRLSDMALMELKYGYASGRPLKQTRELLLTDSEAQGA